MINRAVVACAAGAMATMLLAPAVASAAPAETTRSAVVQIAKRATPINADGSVDVVMWVRCATRLSAFELDTSVAQADTFGATNLVQAGVVPCDGKRHRTVVNVSPDEGQEPFHPGIATIDVFLGLYSQATGDIEARDSAKVRLYTG